MGDRRSVGKMGGLVIIRFGLRVVNFVIELSHPK